jgi:plastocyanin
MKGAFVLLLLGGVAQATPVRGTVTLPVDKPEPPSGHWRIENGLLPVAPRSEPAEAAVALEPATPAAIDAPAPVVVELHGLRIDPRVITVAVGGVVQFHNGDRVPHTLFVDKQASVMAPETTPAGQTRGQKFAVAGEYRVRDQELPHVGAWVLALTTPYVTTLDEKGAFKLDVPEGKYTVRLFYRGAWVVSQALTIGSKATEVSISVPKGRE